MPSLSRQPFRLLRDLCNSATAPSLYSDFCDEALGISLWPTCGPTTFCPLHRSKIAPAHSLIAKFEIPHCRDKGGVTQQVTQDSKVNVIVRKFRGKRMAQAMNIEVGRPKPLAPVVEPKLDSTDR
jgi:hypothetical protein